GTIGTPAASAPTTATTVVSVGVAVTATRSAPAIRCATAPAAAWSCSNDSASFPTRTASARSDSTRRLTPVGIPSGDRHTRQCDRAARDRRRRRQLAEPDQRDEDGDDGNRVERGAEAGDR